MSTNTERLAQYKRRMKAAGFERLSVYVSGDLVRLIDSTRQPSECRGRVLERLLMGKAAKRPDYWTPEEKAVRQARKGIIRPGKT